MRHRCVLRLLSPAGQVLACRICWLRPLRDRLTAGTAAGHLGAVFRTVLETMRTLFVWLVGSPSPRPVSLSLPAGWLMTLCTACLH